MSSTALAVDFSPEHGREGNRTRYPIKTLGEPLRDVIVAVQKEVVKREITALRTEGVAVGNATSLINAVSGVVGSTANICTASSELLTANMSTVTSSAVCKLVDLDTSQFFVPNIGQSYGEWVTNAFIFNIYLPEIATNSVSALPTNADAIRRIKSDLEEMSHLQANWDGYDADAVSTEAVRFASEFIDIVGTEALFFEPYADPDGSVGLEGHKDDRSIYLSFSPERKIAYVAKIGGAVHRGHSADVPTIKKLLDVLF